MKTFMAAVVLCCAAVRMPMSAVRDGVRRLGKCGGLCVLWCAAQRDAVHDAGSLPVCAGENVYANDASGLPRERWLMASSSIEA